jgi:hypothetical protein
VNHDSTVGSLRNNKSTSQRTLHIDVKYFFLRDRLLRKQLKLVHTPTEQMIPSCDIPNFFEYVEISSLEERIDSENRQSVPNLIIQRN